MAPAGRLQATGRRRAHPTSENSSSGGEFGKGNSFGSRSSFGADRPTNMRGAGLGSLTGRGRGGSSFMNTSMNGSRFGVRSGRSNFGGGRFAGGGRFQNASFSRSGNRGFRGSRGFGYGHAGFRRSGWGYGGFRHYGYGGWGGDPWFSDLWFLGDLFGLALDFGRFAIAPAWGILAPSLLNVGLQAVNSLNSDDDSYGNSYRTSYGSANDIFDNGQFFDNADYQVHAAQSSYPALCGRYYSDENPGCRQEF